MMKLMHAGQSSRTDMAALHSLMAGMRAAILRFPAACPLLAAAAGRTFAGSGAAMRFRFRVRGGCVGAGAAALLGGSRLRPTRQNEKEDQKVRHSRWLARIPSLNQSACEIIRGQAEIL